MDAPLSVNMIVSIQFFATSFMAIYAVDEENLIHAADAEAKKIYWCLNCFGPVKQRKGKIPHFYHLREAPSCRLYSKSEDHLVAQLELERLFPGKAVQIEKPFIQIDRVADLCWEKEKIVFEIQCSQIAEAEVEARIRDYQTAGYDVVWLLDDRRFNRRVCRPAEEFLRRRSAYFLSIESLEVYDQFEVFVDGKRVRKSRPLAVDLTKIYRTPQLHFFNDRLNRSLRFPEEALREKEIEKSFKKPNRFVAWVKKRVADPYRQWIEKMARKY